MFTPSDSLKDQAECVLSLINKCTEIITKNGYSGQDTRTASIVNVRFVSYSAVANANLLHSWTLENNISKEIIPALLGLTDVNEKSVKLMGDSIHKTSKLSLILIGQFQIENCIANINEVLGLSNSQGFYTKASSLINFLGLDTHKLDILNTGAQIRNSLHSNGIHHGYRQSDFHSEIEGVNYDFIHNQKVSCASLPHIAHCLESSVKVLDEIINATQIKQITSLIEDKYVAQLNLE